MPNPIIQQAKHSQRTFSFKKGTTLCIIEAMKIMNEIEAEYDGKVVDILVNNSEPVEYNQPLFIIDPS